MNCALRRTGVSTFVPGTMRLARRASTLPGPTSTKRVAPASCSAVNVSRQRTGRTSAPARARRARRSNGCAEAQEKTVKRGSPSSTSSSAARNGATAGAMRRRVEGAGDRQADRALAELAAPSPRRASKRVAVAGEHDLAGRVVVGDGEAGGVGDLRASSSSAPTRAIIEPRSSASAIRRPRRTTSSSASSTVSTPAAASAASSPSEWPAAAPGATSSARPRQPAIEAQKMAGCWKRVLSSTRANGILADELDGSARAARGSAARRGRASRGSGSPGRGTGVAVSGVEVTADTLAAARV